MNKLKQWLANATTEEREQLADKAGTTVGSLRQLAGSYKGAKASASMARRIEQAAAALHRKGLPVINREGLCPACKECEFAKACRS